jgi:hypothetical protein
LPADETCRNEQLNRKRIPAAGHAGGGDVGISVARSVISCGRRLAIYFAQHAAAAAQQASPASQQAALALQQSAPTTQQAASGLQQSEAAGVCGAETPEAPTSENSAVRRIAFMGMSFQE